MGVNLRIVSDGTSAGTRVETADGVPVDRVTSVAWMLEGGRPARAVVTLMSVPVELVGEAVTVDDPTGAGVRGMASPAGDASRRWWQWWRW